MPKGIDAITKLYDFILWFVPKLEKFPRSQKYLIGDRIETRMRHVARIPACAGRAGCNSEARIPF
jgi:hypothetical protein